MSDGGIGSGLSYWASIKISGDLNAKQLKKVVDQIQAILVESIDGKPVDGSIVSETRASSKSVPSFNVGFAAPKKKKKKS